jgi:hypothetical protein
VEFTPEDSQKGPRAGDVRLIEIERFQQPAPNRSSRLSCPSGLASYEITGPSGLQSQNRHSADRGRLPQALPPFDSARGSQGPAHGKPFDSRAGAMKPSHATASRLEGARHP